MRVKLRIERKLGLQMWLCLRRALSERWRVRSVGDLWPRLLCRRHHSNAFQRFFILSFFAEERGFSFSARGYATRRHPTPSVRSEPYLPAGASRMRRQLGPLLKFVNFHFSAIFYLSNLPQLTRRLSRSSMTPFTQTSYS